MATSDESKKEIEQRILRLSDLVDEPLRNIVSIGGYEDMPIVTLEKAVEPLIPFLPTVQNYAYAAKQRCKKPPVDGLTIDESASIMLYSMGWKPHDQCLYFGLNAVLRSEHRNKLKPWLLYLKLFLTALSRLPSSHQFVFRGVKLDLHRQYPKGETIVWQGFSSCTTSIDVLQSNIFLGAVGERTMFAIECFSGKDIQQHAYFSSEDEILLLTATQFKVMGSLNQGNGLHTIQLREIQPPIAVLHQLLLPCESNNKHSVDNRRESDGIHNVTRKKSQKKDNVTETVQSTVPIDVNEVKGASGVSKKLPGALSRLFSNGKANKNETNQYQNIKLQQKIQQLKSYSEVDLGGLELIDEDMEIVVREIIIKKQCKTLYLPSNKITSAGALILAQALKNNKRLKELYLYDNQIGDEGVHYFCQALALNNNVLQGLFLGKNGITDEGAKHLVQIIKINKTLTHLWLRKNKISEEGIQLLKTTNTNIISLDLSQN